MIDDLWYKNTVIYSLDVKTFMDSNGDGIGDFEGLMRRLDYLSSLGVGALWLAPFQPSPNRDNGYDISDYYGVDARHGADLRGHAAIEVRRRVTRHDVQRDDVGADGAGKFDCAASRFAGQGRAVGRNEDALVHGEPPVPAG